MNFDSDPLEKLSDNSFSDIITGLPGMDIPGLLSLILKIGLASAIATAFMHYIFANLVERGRIVENSKSTLIYKVFIIFMISAIFFVLGTVKGIIDVSFGLSS